MRTTRCAWSGDAAGCGREGIRCATAAIADLNPFILRGVTPPKDSFTVRVPVGGATAFDSNFAALSERDRTAFTRVTTRKGDGFGTIAERAASVCDTSSGTIRAST